jgi:hypothetical protein
MFTLPTQLRVTDLDSNDVTLFDLISGNDNRFSVLPAWFNEDNSLAIQFVNDTWVIAGVPFSSSSIIYSSNNNWPLVEVVE